MKTISLITILTVFLLTGCKAASKAASSSGGSSGGGSSKAVLSSWATSNAAWAIRLDLNGANLDGTSFTLVVKFSDNSETWCTNSYLAGDQSTGTYNTGTCTGHGGMSNSSPSSFETGGVGSYTKSGSTFQFCKHDTSCYTYY
jgi:hypothetical protein